MEEYRITMPISKQRFIQYSNLNEELLGELDSNGNPKKLIDYHIESLNELENPGLYLRLVQNYSELLEIRKRIDEIKDKQIKEELLEKTNEYIIQMNRLQNAFDNNTLQEFLSDPNTIIYFYSQYFNDEYGTLTEEGKEVAKAINASIPEYDKYTPRINIGRQR